MPPEEDDCDFRCSRSLKSEYADNNNPCDRTTNEYGYRPKSCEIDLLTIEHVGITLVPSQLKVLSAPYHSISKHETILWLIK